MLQGCHAGAANHLADMVFDRGEVLGMARFDQQRGLRPDDNEGSVVAMVLPALELLGQTSADPEDARGNLARKRNWPFEGNVHGFTSRDLWKRKRPWCGCDPSAAGYHRVRRTVARRGRARAGWHHSPVLSSR